MKVPVTSHIKMFVIKNTIFTSRDAASPASPNTTHRHLLSLSLRLQRWAVFPWPDCDLFGARRNVIILLVLVLVLA